MTTTTKTEKNIPPERGVVSLQQFVEHRVADPRVGAALLRVLELQQRTEQAVAELVEVLSALPIGTARRSRR